MNSPALRHPPELLLKAQGLRVLVLAVDGVLCDGTLTFSEQGAVQTRLHTLDVEGLLLLQQTGIAPVIVSQRDEPVLRTALQTLGLRHVHLGVPDKRAAAQTVLNQLHLTWQQAAAMGCDWSDLPLISSCALACTPPGAQAELHALSQHGTQAAGGQGAVRQVCDLLLCASGRYAPLLRQAMTSGVHDLEALA